MRLEFQYINRFFLKFGSFFAPFRSGNYKNMKGYIIIKLMYVFIHKRVKGNVYNDQRYKDFVYELGLQPSFGNFTLSLHRL